jgi:hypothetical protein
MLCKETCIKIGSVHLVRREVCVVRGVDPVLGEWPAHVLVLLQLPGVQDVVAGAEQEAGELITVPALNFSLSPILWRLYVLTMFSSFSSTYQLHQYRIIILYRLIWNQMPPTGVD